MFDIDSGKLIILGVIALIVIKPKDLPGVMRQVGATISQLRRMAGEFQGQFKDAMREAELDELKKDMEKATDFDGLNPFTDMKKDLDQTRSHIETALHAPVNEHTFAESIEPPLPVATEALAAPPLPPETVDPHASFNMESYAPQPAAVAETPPPAISDASSHAGAPAQTGSKS